MVPIMFCNGEMATGRQFDLPYLVEQWDDSDSHVEELIALIGDYQVRGLRLMKQSSADREES